LSALTRIVIRVVSAYALLSNCSTNIQHSSSGCLLSSGLLLDTTIFDNYSFKGVVLCDSYTSVSTSSPPPKGWYMSYPSYSDIACYFALVRLYKSVTSVSRNCSNTGTFRSSYICQSLSTCDTYLQPYIVRK
jgi:hypothetical protein